MISTLKKSTLFSECLSIWKNKYSNSIYKPLNTVSSPIITVYSKQQLLKGKIASPIPFLYWNIPSLIVFVVNFYTGWGLGNSLLFIFSILSAQTLRKFSVNVLSMIILNWQIEFKGSQIINHHFIVYNTTKNILIQSILSKSSHKPQFIDFMDVENQQLKMQIQSKILSSTIRIALPKQNISFFIENQKLLKQGKFDPNNKDFSLKDFQNLKIYIKTNKKIKDQPINFFINLKENSYRKYHDCGIATVFNLPIQTDILQK